MYVTAATCPLTPETCFQLVPPANVVTGVDLSVVLLIPRFPSPLYPQLHKVPSVLIATVV